MRAASGYSQRKANTATENVTATRLEQLVDTSGEDGGYRLTRVTEVVLVAGAASGRR